MEPRTLRLSAEAPYRSLVGVGGVGTGIFLALAGDHDLGRNESRPARLLDVHDRCKLHIIAHYPALLLGARPSGSPFRVVPIAKVGDDEAGRRLRREMEGVGMDCRFVDVVADRPTLQSVCFQYPDGSGGNITTSDSAAAALSASEIDRASELIDARTIALAAPEAPLEARGHLLSLATDRGAFRVAAFASGEIEEAKRLGLLAQADLVAFNEDEAETLAGQRFDAGDPRPLLDACVATLGAARTKIRILLTAGAHGAFGFDGGCWKHCPALDVPVASTAGAGDALLAGTLAALAAGAPFAGALDFGSLLAAYKVTSPHTIHPDASLDALLAFAADHRVAFDDTVIRLF
jgi:sugar/nucleoside kinase (ribokinase family)